MQISRTLVLVLFVGILLAFFSCNTSKKASNYNGYNKLITVSGKTTSEETKNSETMHLAEKCYDKDINISENDFKSKAGKIYLIQNKKTVKNKINVQENLTSYFIENKELIKSKIVNKKNLQPEKNPTIITGLSLMFFSFVAMIILVNFVPVSSVALGTAIIVIISFTFWIGFFVFLAGLKIEKRKKQSK